MGGLDAPRGPILASDVLTPSSSPRELSSSISSSITNIKTIIIAKSSKTSSQLKPAEPSEIVLGKKIRVKAQTGLNENHLFDL